MYFSKLLKYWCVLFHAFPLYLHNIYTCIFHVVSVQNIIYKTGYYKCICIFFNKITRNIFVLSFHYSIDSIWRPALLHEFITLHNYYWKTH